MISLSPISFAKSYDTVAGLQLEQNTSPDVTGDCPVYGVHRAYAQAGWYFVDVDGVRQKNIFVMYKCSGCGEYLICDGYPDSVGGALGHWFQTYYDIGYVDNYYVVKVHAANYYYKSTPGLPGWTFNSSTGSIRQ